MQERTLKFVFSYLMPSHPQDILKQYWGYSSFRPLQEDIIQSILQGKDTLALLPTGGGKSICFQVPALCKDGLCMVITPLVALMIDQVENLQKRGIPAVCVHSGMQSREIRLALEKCMDGRSRFLYLSPERLDNSIFREVARHLPVSLIAVDEAHCISQWGYDFRPPYLKITEIRPLFPKVPVIALTATAVPEVVTDIQQKLGFGKENVFSKSFYRDNLAYLVYKEEDKLGKLLRICSRIQGTGIVYVRNRKLTRETSEFLNRNGIKSNYYHAGLEPAVRMNRQKEWMEEKVRIMVATNAFGMGIDKPNVRVVVHLDLPDNLEAYFQEAGRAGRDEKASYAVVLYNESDLINARHFLEISWPEPALIRQVYQALGNYYQLAVGSGKDMMFGFDLDQFSMTYKFKPVLVFSVLKILERDGYITLPEGSDASSRIMFLADRNELYKYQVENREQDRLIKVLLRSYSGFFSDYTAVNEYEIAKRLGAGHDYVVAMLQAISKDGVIDYIPRRTKPQLVFTSERLDPADLELSRTFYFDRKKQAAYKLEEMIRYVSREEGCRSQFLLNYFGDTRGSACGKCDLCIAAKQSGQRDDTKRIREEILNIVRMGPVSIKDLVEKMKETEEKEIIGIVRKLLDENRLLHDSGMLQTGSG